MTELIFISIIAICMAIMYLLGVCALFAELASRLRRKEELPADDLYLVEIFLLVPFVSLIWFLTGSDGVLRLAIMVLAGISIVAFLYLAHRRRPARTNVVVVANCCLLAGPVSWIIYSCWQPGVWIFIMLSLPVVALGFMVLMEKRNNGNKIPR